MLDEHQAEDVSEVPSVGTRTMTLSRMNYSEKLEWLLTDKVRDDPNQFQIDTVMVGPERGLLVWEQSDVADTPWASAVRSLTEQELELTKSSSSAAILVNVDRESFAVAFGMGRHFLRNEMLDHEFGLSLAVRLLDPDKVKRITRSPALTSAWGWRTCVTVSGAVTPSLPLNVRPVFSFRLQQRARASSPIYVRFQG